MTQSYTSTLLQEGYERVLHPCGMDIYLCRKPVTTTSAMLGVKFGSANMPTALTDIPLGTAHFLEHKVFEGKRGENFDFLFSETGAEVNAYTSYDRTVYYMSCTDHWQKNLLTLLRMLSELWVTKASVEREKTIIAEEIRMNNDSPFERCYAELLLAMYQNHRMREEICGSEDSIKDITPKLLRDVFATYYRPDNMILTVCGQVEMTEVLALVDRVYGGFNRQKMKPLTGDGYCFEPTHPAKTYTELSMPVPKPLMSMGVKVRADEGMICDPQALFRKDLRMALLCELLFSRSGELYDRLFEGGMITPTYAYGYATGKDYSYFAVSCECDSPKDVYDAICAYIDEIKEKGFAQKDFERCRRVLYADYVTGFDAPEDIASCLLSYAFDGVGVFDYTDTLFSLTQDEVMTFFLDSFQKMCYTLSVVSNHEGDL